jgi:L,D-peptidoglycan transpeptidase YkuD (ErfK/YbiS/YcfS/YnhG family)
MRDDVDLRTTKCLWRLTLRGRGAAATRGWIESGWLRLPCALGRSGRSARKREGDGATPIGRFRLVAVLYRPDQRGRPQTGLPVRAIGPEQGWCDASTDRNYNRQVRLPYPASTERMWREDRLYDLVVVLDHNTRPRMRFGGSAIFMHVARPGYTPTEGCIALSEKHMALLLARLRPGAAIVVPR